MNETMVVVFVLPVIVVAQMIGVWCALDDSIAEMKCDRMIRKWSYAYMIGVTLGLPTYLLTIAARAVIVILTKYPKEKSE